MIRSIVVLFVLGISGCLLTVGLGPWGGSGDAPYLEQTVVRTDYFTVQKLIRVENPLDENLVVVVDCGTKETDFVVKGHSFIDHTWQLDIADNHCSIVTWNFTK